MPRTGRQALAADRYQQGDAQEEGEGGSDDDEGDLLLYLVVVEAVVDLDHWDADGVVPVFLGPLVAEGAN